MFNMKMRLHIYQGFAPEKSERIYQGFAPGSAKVVIRIEQASMLALFIFIR